MTIFFTCYCCSHCSANCFEQKGLSDVADQSLPNYLIQEEVSNMPDSPNCDDNRYKINSEEITHNDSSQNAQAESQNEKETAKLSGQEKRPLPLIDSLVEISIDAFIQKVGKDFFSGDPVLANALRIAEVEMNSALFSLDRPSSLDTFHLELFDGSLKQIRVKTFSPGAAVDEVNRDDDPAVGLNYRSDKSLETHESGAIGMDEKDYNDLSSDENTYNVKKVPVNKVVPSVSGSIILDFQEIPVTCYQRLYGQQHFMSNQVISVSDRIARVTVNKNILNQEAIDAGDHLSFIVFDDKHILLNIKNVNKFLDSFSISGVVDGSISSFVALSITDNQVLASIKVNDRNTLYSLIFNPNSSQYYLYQSLIDKIEKVDESNVLIPPQ